jgi:hypothetical protein
MRNHLELSWKSTTCVREKQKAERTKLLILIITAIQLKGRWLREEKGNGESEECVGDDLRRF